MASSYWESGAASPRGKQLPSLMQLASNVVGHSAAYGALAVAPPAAPVASAAAGAPSSMEREVEEEYLSQLRQLSTARRITLLTELVAEVTRSKGRS